MSRERTGSSEARRFEGTLLDVDLGALRSWHVQRPALGAGSLAQLMRYCESSALTCEVLLLCHADRAVLSYRRGDLVRILFNWNEPGGDGTDEPIVAPADAHAPTRFRITLPPGVPLPVLQPPPAPAIPNPRGWESSSIIAIEDDTDRPFELRDGRVRPVVSDNEATSVYPLGHGFDSVVTAIFDHPGRAARSRKTHAAPQVAPARRRTRRV